MNRLSFGARGLFLLSIVAIGGACGGDPEERTPAEPDASSDATRIDSGRDATLPPPPPDDSGTPPDDGATRPDDGTLPPDDASTPPDDAGPGTCRSQDDCARGEVCSFAGLTCADRPIGRCGPAGCTPDVTTMCLCDGRTFEGSSSCPPAPVAHFGACETMGTLCGTRGAGPCAANEYCDYVEGSLCGAADEGGVCRVRPDACDTVLDPVCGCDGTTYSNACLAAAAGIDVATTGECGTTTRSCVDTACEGGLTCIGGPTCGDSWSCAALGRLCTDDLVPYCGCNGVTFEDSSTCPRLAFAWMGTCDRPMGLVSCDRAAVLCRRVEPTCPEGEAPSVLGTCWGPCVPIEQCSCLPGEIRNTCPTGSTGCAPEGHCAR